MMEDFGEAGFEAGAFASGEDENGCVVIGHGRSIVYWTRGFGNAGVDGGKRIREKQVGGASPAPTKGTI